MEGSVTLSLKEYTDLILEKHKAEEKLSALKRQVERRAGGDIKENLIYSLNEEKVKEWLTEQDQKRILNEFGPYSWTYETVANEVLVFSVEEIKQIYLSIIMKMLDSHLKDFLPER